MKASRSSGLSRDDLKKLKREQAEARKVLYREMKPLQEAYARLEKELEAALNAQTAVEALLADPDVYNDSAKATALLKDFHACQTKSETLLEKLGQAEAALAPYEERKAALADDDE